MSSQSSHFGSLPETTIAHCQLISPWQNGRHFADDIFQMQIREWKIYILIKTSLNYISKGPIDNNPALG